MNLVVNILDINRSSFALQSYRTFQVRMPRSANLRPFPATACVREFRIVGHQSAEFFTRVPNHRPAQGPARACILACIDRDSDHGGARTHLSFLRRCPHAHIRRWRMKSSHHLRTRLRPSRRTRHAPTHLSLIRRRLSIILTYQREPLRANDEYAPERTLSVGLEHRFVVRELAAITSVAIAAIEQVAQFTGGRRRDGE